MTNPDLYYFDSTDAVVDAIVDGAREYASEPDEPGEYWNGYMDGIRSALAAIGLQGAAFERTMRHIFDDIS